MATRVAINGFGRIGRAFFRQALLRDDLEIVAINDLGNLENLAYLLRFDSVYRRFEHEIEVQESEEGRYLIVDGTKIAAISEAEPEKLPWGEMKIDVVVESTGFFVTQDGASKHLAAGAKRVVISAPGKGGVQQLLIGTDDDRFADENLPPVTCNASCTTNASAPVASVLESVFGISKGMVQTVHGYTSTQSLVDSPVRGKDFRRGRAAAVNIIPSTTGAAKAVSKSIPELEGNFDGIAIRVPTISGSLAMLTVVTKKPTTVEEVNSALVDASNEPRWSGILAITEDPLTSVDIIGRTEPAIVEIGLTHVTGGDLVTVYSWYDNEWGYTYSLVEHVLRVGARG